MSKTATPSSTEHNWVPWTLTAAALTSFAALFFTADRLIGLPILGLLLVPSHMVKWRLPSSRITSWGLRILLVVATIAWLGWPHEDIKAWYLQPQFTRLFGFLLAIEYVLRAWERHDASRPGEAWGVALLLTALILTAASNTFVRTYLRVLAPLYLLFVALFLRSFVRWRRVTFDVREKDEKTPPAVRWRLAAMRGAAVIIALGIGLLISELIARFDYQLTSLAVRLLQQTVHSRGEIGFDSSPQLEATFNPQASAERVLRIEGPRGERHFRIMAYDAYNSRTWLPNLHDRQFRELRDLLPSRSPPATGGSRLHVTRLADTLDLLPMPLETTGINIPGSVERDRLGTLRGLPPTSNFAYDLETPASETPPRPNLSLFATHPDTPVNAATDAIATERALMIPNDIDPRVMSLARKVAGDGDAATRVIRIAQYLRSTHGYSLEFKPQGEPLNDFILNGRPAHCQYFGSAVVMMARAAGIPSRYVTGFYVHETHGANTMIVRQRDAHAWAECWLDGAGWVTVDATPSAGRPDEEFPDVPRARAWWEAFQDFLANVKQSILALDSRKVLEAVGMLSLLGLIVALLRFLLSRRKRGGTAAGYSTPSVELAQVAARFEQWLTAHSGEKADDRTWRERLTGLRLPAPGADACAAFLAAYDDVRFGGITEGKIRRADALLADVEHQG